MFPNLQQLEQFADGELPQQLLPFDPETLVLPSMDLFEQTKDIADLVAETFDLPLQGIEIGYFLPLVDYLLESSCLVFQPLHQLAHLLTWDLLPSRKPFLHLGTDLATVVGLCPFLIEQHLHSGSC